MVKYIEHNHIVLRKARMDDLNDLYNNLWSSKEVAKYLFWKESDSLEEAKERLLRTIDYQSNNHGFVVALKDTDEAIGITGIYEYEPSSYRESGLCIGEKFQGNGYGKEMLEMLLYLAFEVFKAHKFRYSCITENVRSKNLCSKYGFKYYESKKEVRKWDNQEFMIDYFYLDKNKYFEYKHKG
ncbi:MAG: GNAT family N-acetyltransferase [Bacilli bacterium]|nr:GNAT family N-acetyltransferase [Bacilli bacterium]